MVRNVTPIRGHFTWFSPFVLLGESQCWPAKVTAPLLWSSHAAESFREIKRNLIDDVRFLFVLLLLFDFY